MKTLALSSLASALAPCLAPLTLLPFALMPVNTVHAQTAVPGGWQSCQAMTGNPTAQLKCFQDWAAAQAQPVTPPVAAEAPVRQVSPAASTMSMSPAKLAALPPLPVPAADASRKPVGCRDDNYSALSRFWELQRGTDCDTFGLRGYKPTTLALVASDSVNTQPSSPAAGHTALSALPYTRHELKIQLSVRTKIAKGLLKHGAEDSQDHDSVWFGYTQQSYWQLFNGALSRPFRNTDHEPEVVYIYPHQIPLGGDWNYRLSGLGVVHQSNGQSLPLSRSWNRVYLMGAAEKILSPTSSLSLQGKAWQRLKESSGNDDNPGIENYIGRAELAGNWQINQTDSLGLTLRHSLTSQARGSVRLDWMLAPGSAPRYTGLRYHLQLFSGYGDSLVDYNRRRTVLSMGLSLVDW
ncbi:MAG: phospholipase A [Pseudomonadota bacterium]